MGTLHSPTPSSEFGLVRVCTQILNDWEAYLRTDVGTDAYDITCFPGKHGSGIFIYGQAGLRQDFFRNKIGRTDGYLVEIILWLHIVPGQTGNRCCHRKQEKENVYLLFHIAAVFIIL